MSWKIYWINIELKIALQVSLCVQIGIIIIIIFHIVVIYTTRFFKRIEFYILHITYYMYMLFSHGFAFAPKQRAESFI